MYKRGGYDVTDQESIYDFIERVTMDGERFNEEEGERIIMLGDIDVNFTLWVHDGNVCEIEKGVFTTQDTCWSHRFNGLAELKEYFVKQFCDEQVKLKYEIENSGEWIVVGGNVYLNTNDGRMADESSLHYGDCWDMNVSDGDVEFFDNFNKLDLIRIERYFPKTIQNYKMSKIREKAEWLLSQVEGDYHDLEMLAKEIIALTK